MVAGLTMSHFVLSLSLPISTSSLIHSAAAGARVQTGGAVGLRFIVFLRFSFVFGMHMPLLGWKLILGWI